MDTLNHDSLLFHLSGRCQGEGLSPVAGTGLWPAALAPYRDLDALRHDFPVVIDDRSQAVHTLSSLVDTLLQDVAPRGIEGERLRRHALQIETLIRRAVAAGSAGAARTLAEHWDAAVATLAQGEEGPTLEQVLTQAGGALRARGDLLGCEPALPARLLTAAWQVATREKARAFRADLARLSLKLSDILRAARSHSQAGVQPQALRASLGGSHRDAFDFDALSRIVGKGVPVDELPAARRRRLEGALAVLEAQRFFAPSEAAAAAEGSTAHGFCFPDCESAAQAFAQRLPELVALVKAMSMAELEVQGRYDEVEHDVFFEAFDAHMLGSDDLARFPEYLICIPPERTDAPENARLLDLLSAGLPMKVLVQTQDLQEEAAIGTGHFAFGVRSSRLATTAMGLGGLFVLQSAASNLVALAPQLARGMACSGPALFSVYAPPDTAQTGLPPYLACAAAMQSRAFAAFCYDAQAGENWAERFSLLNNPQPEADWPGETLEYADARLQRVRLPVSFTYADFVLCDPRAARHFVRLASDRWTAQQVPAADWLALPEAQAATRVPYVLAVDAQDALQRLLVDRALMQAARRCLLLWHRLQEHGGINDSHAQSLLARERAAWAAEQQTQAAAAPLPVVAPAPAPVTPPGAADDAAPEPAPGRSRDDAWIDTARCPSCNECQQINDRMFAYDERKQAYIKDLGAGTYRQLVEAAESCQVAIIHPGKPRDPNEPGLEELLARAEPFR